MSVGTAAGAAAGTVAEVSDVSDASDAGRGAVSEGASDGVFGDGAAAVAAWGPAAGTAGLSAGSRVFVNSPKASDCTIFSSMPAGNGSGRL